MIACILREEVLMALEAAYIVPHPPLIIPAVGRGKEAAIQTTIDAYDDVARRIAEIAPDTIVITSPHATAYADYFHVSPGDGAHGDMSAFGVRDNLLECSYDGELAGLIDEIASETGFPAGTDYERDPRIDHATYIPLHFVNKFYSNYKVVRIGLSGLDPVAHYQMGKIVNAAIERLGRRAVFIASGDLSHKLTQDGPYGFAPEGPQFDAQVTEMMGEGDFLGLLSLDDAFCDKAAECGLRSFQIMAGALDGKAIESTLLSYEGPYGVGYAIAMFHVKYEDATRCFDRLYTDAQKEKVLLERQGEDSYVALARKSVECFVRDHTPLPMPSDLPLEMREERAGVFVSLHEHGRLRGCIGTIGPVTGSVAEEIVRNAISACSEDPRFAPVRIEELDQLEISVDVLGEPEPVDSRADLDPQRFGVIVTNGTRRGLLLPMLDGVDTVDDQIEIAMRKAGIGAHEDGTTLQRFEVVRHEAHVQA